MPINDIYECKLFSSLDMTTAVNVRHYTVSVIGPPEPTIVEYGIDVSTLIAGDFRGIMVVGSTYHGLVIQKIFPLPPGGGVPITTANGVGTAVGEPLPHQIAGLISLRTTQIGRRRRGRFYIPFPSESNSMPPGVPDAGYGILMSNLAAALATSLAINGGAGGTATLVPVVWSRTGLFATPIFTTLIRNRWATVRKRSAFNGPDAPSPV